MLSVADDQSACCTPRGFDMPKLLQPGSFWRMAITFLVLLLGAVGQLWMGSPSGLLQLNVWWRTHCPQRRGRRGVRPVSPAPHAVVLLLAASLILSSCRAPSQTPDGGIPQLKANASSSPASTASASPTSTEASMPTIIASDQGAQAILPLVTEVLREVMDRTAEQLQFRPERPVTVHVATTLDGALKQSRAEGTTSDSESFARDGRSFASTPRDARGQPRSHRMVLNFIYPDQLERPRMLATIAHEYTHLAQQGLVPATSGESPLPRWFTEGQAVHQAQRLTGQTALEIALAVRDQRTAAAPPLSELTQGRDWLRGEATYGTGVVYARSYATVRYLVERYGVEATVRLVREGKGTSADFHERLASLTTGDLQQLDRTVGAWLMHVPHAAGVADGGARTDVVVDPADGRARAVVTFTRDLSCSSGQLFKAGEYFASNPFTLPRAIGPESGRPAAGAVATGTPLWLHGVVSQLLPGVNSTVTQPGIVLALAPEQSLNLSWSRNSRGGGQTVSLFARYSGSTSLDGAVVAADPTIGCTHEPLVFGAGASPVSMQAPSGLRLDGVRFDDARHVQLRLSATRDLPCRDGRTIERARVLASGYVDLGAATPIQLWSSDMLIAFGLRPDAPDGPVQAAWLEDSRGCGTGWLAVGASFGAQTVAATTEDGALDLLLVRRGRTDSAGLLLLTTNRDLYCGDAYPAGRKYFASYLNLTLRPDGAFNSSVTQEARPGASTLIQGSVEEHPGGRVSVRGQFRFQNRTTSCDSGARSFQSAPQ